MKRFSCLFFLLALLLTFAACGGNGNSSDGNKPTNPDKVNYDRVYEYSLENEEIKIVECLVDDKKIEIPSQINSKPVTVIGESAFLMKTRTEEIIIPDTVHTLQFQAFSNCEALTAITIPSSIKTIGERAFYLCKGLKDIVISDGVTKIDNEAFYRCYGIEEIKIPKSVETMGVGVFYRANSLEKISVDKDNKNYTDVDGVLFSKDKTLLHTYPEAKQGESYTVPDTVTKIAEMAFGYECKDLKIITIPASVKEIEDKFNSRSDLKFIVDKGSYAEEYLKGLKLNVEVR